MTTPAQIQACRRMNDSSGGKKSMHKEAFDNREISGQFKFVFGGGSGQTDFDCLEIDVVGERKSKHKAPWATGKVQIKNRGKIKKQNPLLVFSGGL
ncbi:MAG: hypothetical protein PHY82_02815 [Lentisphaeria bacterium]|nr:hypothetical protein [Lentisphaeria bacterium]